MKLNIQSIHFTAASRLTDHIQKKCDKLDVFFDRIIEGEVFLKLKNEEKGANKLVEIKLHVPGDTLVAKENAKTFEAATDLVVGKLKSQLVKYKEKMRTN